MAQGILESTRTLGKGARLILSADATAAALAGLHHGSDADLLRAAANRDAKAFGRLVVKYHNLVYRVVWRMTDGSTEAEDIAQDAFLKLWNNPGQVRDAAALKAWLMRVAHNLAMDRFRRKPDHTMDAADEVSDSRPNAEDRMEKDWVARRINKAVASLPERQKQALVLAHFEQLPQSEAAQIMDLSVDAFESLLARARRALKDQLTEDKQDLLSALTEKE
jgi:RNA polymerase sigma-70 factor, ECF subfamily